MYTGLLDNFSIASGNGTAHAEFVAIRSSDPSGDSIAGAESLFDIFFDVTEDPAPYNLTGTLTGGFDAFGGIGMAQVMLSRTGSDGYTIYWAEAPVTPQPFEDTGMLAPGSYQLHMIARTETSGGSGSILDSSFSSTLTFSEPSTLVTRWQRDPSTPGDWAVDAHWTANAPTSSVAAYIDNGGTAAISSGVSQASMLIVGESASGHVTQTGGAVTIGSRLAIGLNTGSSGSYTIQGGSLNTETLEVGLLGAGTISIDNSAASITVSGKLSFGTQGALSAVPGSAIRITGNQFTNASTNATALADLRNLILIFEGGPSQTATFEVAGKDLGATMAGFDNNFALGTLQIGSDNNVGRVQLVDLIDNQPDWEGHEALYVENLIVRSGCQFGIGDGVGWLEVGNLILEAGSYLDLNGLNLYYQNASIDPGSTIDISHGGDLIHVPEPSTLALLGIGAIGLVGFAWRRRKQMA